MRTTKLHETSNKKRALTITSVDGKAILALDPNEGVKTNVLAELQKTLNKQQLFAISTSHEKSALVLAGAGSGKTKVLTTRIAWLISNSFATIDEILAVTFTNKAAKEMQHRVSTQIDIPADKKVWIGTFHSIALRLLSRHHKEAELPSYFQVLDSQDQINILKRLIKAANLDENNYVPKDLQKFINNQKEQGLRAKSMIPEGLRQEIWVRLYSDYEDLCNRNGLVDFTELLLRSYELLSNNAAILNEYRQKFRHVLIDEFQDTNQLQYNWIKLLAGPQNYFFAVGDDDQSIYAFRGAKVANMQAFLSDFSVGEPIRLEQNYRSSPEILAAANAIINNNSGRIGKKLWTDRKSSEKIHLYEAYTEEDEAYFVADEIKTLEKSGVKLSEIAILYRSNAQSRVFEQHFYNKGINYRVYGGLRFFDRQEVKHAIAYLRLVVSDNDDEAFLRIVNFPARGIGAVAIKNLQEIAETKKISLLDACKICDGRGGRNFLAFADLIFSMKQKIVSLELSDTISYIIESSGLKEHYEGDKKSGIERLENLNELVSAVANFKSENGTNTITEFLAHAVLESTNDSQTQEIDQAVQLLTVHAAKGLEFHTVFAVGLEDGLFPHENCLDNVRDLEEERRLMYVAVTRAKEKLYLLRACSRLMWGKRLSAPISRFVNEIPGELISNISGVSTIGSSSLMDFAGAMASDCGVAAMPTDNPETKISRVNISDKDMVIKIGDMVKHAKFGNGKVMHLNVDGKKMTGEIFFIGVGKKMLDLNIAKIEKC